MIAPSPPNTIAIDSIPFTTSEEQQSRPTKWLAKIRHAWFSVQISHSGKYSIERLLALEEYTRNTSLTRVLMVCIGTPLPMAALVLLQECVPLQDPAEGWSANYGFWIRAGILGGVVAVGMAAFAIYMIPGVALSNLQLALLFTGQAIGYPAIAMLVAALWVFPIPFMVLTIISLYVLLFAALFRIIAGKQVFNQMANHRDELFLLVSFSGSQSIMAITYAAYEVLFDRAIDTYYELPVILLLPLIKIAMKNLVSLSIVHMKDMVPEGVIFTVEFFNSMYLATCMQNTSSITTVTTMMALDFGQTAIALRGLHRRSDTILARLREACGISLDNDSLLPVVRLLCRDKDKFQQQARRDILLYSCLPHKLSSEGRKLLENLKNQPGNGVRPLPRFIMPQFAVLNCCFRTKMKNRVGPLTCCFHHNAEKIEQSNVTIVKPARMDPQQAADTIKPLEITANPHRKILGETLEVLFTSECLLLTEYLESIVPLFYGNYILLVVNLPNAQYHLDLIGISRANVGGTLVNVYIYALLEFTSFVTLTLLMMRNCRLQALYQLAFVLETQMLLVQVKLMTWVLMALSFRVVHFGADFTFTFDWME